MLVDLVGTISQIIFTIEVSIKILAEGHNMMNFFRDEENGAWNKLGEAIACTRSNTSSQNTSRLCLTPLCIQCADFFVVVVGFIEMTPASIIFEAFPVVILRLLRLLRVFRLAKALPRLRSIVEALISGFSAVGWICVLIVVFNYIMVSRCS